MDEQRDDADGTDGSAAVRPESTWYADRFRVGHNAFEFKVDCGHEPAGSDMNTVYLRLIANPFNARELFRMLGTELLSYADAYGAIDDGSAPNARRPGGRP